MIAMRSLYTACIARGLFPLQERLKRHDTVAVRKAMEESQWWDAERLRDLQVARLRRLLAEAGANVPYYHDLFHRLGFDPQAVRTTDALQALPLLTKATIRANLDRFRATNATGLARLNTGGSSGEPLVFYIGRERVSHDVAAKWRATRWWGVDIGDPEIVVWGSPIELGAQDRLRGWRDRLMRTELLPAFEMSATKLDAFVERIRRRRPRMLFGYPSALAHIARHATSRGFKLDELGIAVAFVTAERLYDDQRADIARVFGCRVANGYGGRDAGFIAHECPAGGMHITAEDVVVEIVDGAGRPRPLGEAGEIVVTHLATKDFPFVRYRTGDVGTLADGACECGRGLPRLQEVQGRTTDFIVARDGTVMHGLSLIYVLRDLPGIEAFKVIQDTLERTTVQVVRGTGFGEDYPRRIQAGFRQRLGEGVDVRVELVDAIAPEASGKHRYVVSRIADVHRGAVHA